MAGISLDHLKDLLLRYFTTCDSQYYQAEKDLEKLLEIESDSIAVKLSRLISSTDLQPPELRGYSAILLRRTQTPLTSLPFIRSSLFSGLARAKSKSIAKVLCYTISHLLSSGWNDLLPSIFTLANSKYYTQQEEAFMILGESMTSLVPQHEHHLRSILREGMNSISWDVQFAALKASVELISVTENLNLVEDLLPSMMGMVMLGDLSHAVQVFVALIELAERKPRLLLRLVNPMLCIAEQAINCKSTVQKVTHYLPFEFVFTLVEFCPAKMFTAEMLKSIMGVLMRFVVDAIAYPRFIKEYVGQYFDRLDSIGNLAFIGLWKNFFEFVDSQDWRTQVVGLDSFINTIKFATTARDVIGDELSVLVDKLLSLCDHNVHYVHQRSLVAIAKLSLSIRPVLEREYHKVVIPFLALYLEEENSRPVHLVRKFYAAATILHILDQEPCLDLNEYIIPLVQNIDILLHDYQIATGATKSQAFHMIEQHWKPLNEGTISKQIWKSATALLKMDVHPYVPRGMMF